MNMNTKYQARRMTKERLHALLKSRRHQQGLILDNISGLIVVEPTSDNWETVRSFPLRTPTANCARRGAWILPRGSTRPGAGWGSEWKPEPIREPTNADGRLGEVDYLRSRSIN